MRTESVKTHFAIHEVVVITGFTKYMLDYLAREEIFAPSVKAQGGRGLKRCYTYEDLVILRVLHRICASNGKIRHLKEALLKFRREFGPVKPGQKLDQHLFVQGKELCTFTRTEGGRQIRSGQMTFSFVIDLSIVTKEIAECVVVKPRTKGFVLTAKVAERAEAERQRIWAPVKERRASAV